MKKSRKLLYCSYAVATAILAWGCERDDICPGSTQYTPTAQIQFFVYDRSGVPQESEQVNLHFYGLRGKDRLSEIDLANKAKSVSLPVDFETKESRYLVEKDGLTDTLTLNYTPELEFISKACGFRYIFTGTTVTCTTAGPVLELSKDIEASPTDGKLFNSYQVVAKMYLKTE